MRNKIKIEKSVQENTSEVYIDHLSELRKAMKKKNHQTYVQEATIGKGVE